MIWYDEPYEELRADEEKALYVQLINAESPTGKTWECTEFRVHPQDPEYYPVYDVFCFWGYSNIEDLIADEYPEFNNIPTYDADEFFEYTNYYEQ